MRDTDYAFVSSYRNNRDACLVRLPISDTVQVRRETVAPPGGREKLPPYGWTSKNYVICVRFHCHGTSSYHTTNTLQGRRAKSHVDTHQTIQPGLGTSYSRPPIDPYLTSPLLQNPGGATAAKYPTSSRLWGGADSVFPPTFSSCLYRSVIPSSHRQARTPTKQFCLCRVCLGGVNRILDDSRLAPTESLSTLLAIVQFTPPPQTRHRHDRFVLFGAAV